jgi:hypothetical protein
MMANLEAGRVYQDGDFIMESVTSRVRTYKILIKVMCQHPEYPDQPSENRGIMGFFDNTCGSSALYVPYVAYGDGKAGTRALGPLKPCGRLQVAWAGVLSLGLV